MSDMTIQEMFDKAYLGLAGQGWKKSIYHAFSGDLQCLYRHPDGRKCAVGHIFDDEYFSEKGEGTNCSDLSGNNEKIETFLQEIQEAHDEAGADKLRECIEAFGSSWNLSWPNLEAAQ